MTSSPYMRVLVTSFGYGHGNPPQAPQADLIVDLRRHFRDPHVDPDQRLLTGFDDKVRAHVLATPGVEPVVAYASQMVAVILRDVADHAGELVTVAVGCVGGRHRSVVVAEAIAALLASGGIGAEVTHRDVDRPVICR